jgi:hypothetical protein
LDEAYGYPNEATKTARTLPLVADLPTDAEGRVYLAISAEYCDYILPSEMLPELLSSGAVEEITAQAYLAALPESPSPVS